MGGGIITDPFPPPFLTPLPDDGDPRPLAPTEPEPPPTLKASTDGDGDKRRRLRDEVPRDPGVDSRDRVVSSDRFDRED